jgi:hypothetical protein
MSVVIPLNPQVRKALAVLDTAPDGLADALGCWRAPGGRLDRTVTRQEWRDGLLSGDVDPAALIRTIRLLGFVISPEFDTLLAAHNVERPAS